MPKRNTALANALADRFSISNTQPWRVGVVKSADNTQKTCVVMIMGTDFTDIHYMSTYTPAVDDVVVLLAGGQQLLILGTIVPSPVGS